MDPVYDGKIDGSATTRLRNTVMSLSDLKVSKAKATESIQKLTDGDGLYLFIGKHGTAKSWRLDYAFAGKRYTYTIGKYPVVSLADARTERGLLKRKIRVGINPAQEKKKLRLIARSDAENTFASVGDAWYASKQAVMSKSWRDVNRLNLDRDLNPTIGSLPIGEIDSKVMIGVVEKVAAKRGLKTADRVRQTAGQVFEYAIIKQLTERNPAHVIRNWADIPAKVNHPTLKNDQDIRALIDVLEGYSGYPSTIIAAKLLLITFARKAELLRSTWEQFDLEDRIWALPGASMKMKSPHAVPLSLQAVNLLRLARIYGRGSQFVFPKVSTIDRCMSMTTLNRMFSTMGYGSGKFTPHSARSTASTWLNEHGGYRADAIERQLAHSEKNSVRATYNHAEYWKERVAMMQAWSDFLFPLSAEADSSHAIGAIA